MGSGPANQPPHADPLAYFFTWSTYGTWLPGDERGWTEYRHGWQLPDPVRKLEAEALMSETACRLDREQRNVVERQVAETCRYRGWTLHAVNCRSNHIHAVITADRNPRVVRSQLKAWCTRRLKELELRRKPTLDPSLVRENWWAERGSQRHVGDMDSLEASVLYVRDGQDEHRYRMPRTRG